MEPSRAFWQGKMVAVTGGTGFLGGHLVDQLTALGASVRVLALPPARDHAPQALARVEYAFGDLMEAAWTRARLRDCAVVFHLAGPVAVWGPRLTQMQRIHAQCMRNVLDATPAARVVHTSSIVTIGATRDRQVLCEDSPFNLNKLRVDYVHAKRAAEDIALDAAADGRDVVVVNPGHLVGPEDREKSIMGRLCFRFWKGRLLAAPPGGFSVTDVRDAARGHILAAERGQAGRRYILGGTNLSVRHFLRYLSVAGGLQPRALPRLPRWSLHGLAALAEAYGWCFGKEPYPSLQHTRLNDYYWFVNSDRAKRELGYATRPLLDSLTDTNRWFHAYKRMEVGGLHRWWMRPRQRVAVALLGRFARPGQGDIEEGTPFVGGDEREAALAGEGAVQERLGDGR